MKFLFALLTLALSTSVQAAPTQKSKSQNSQVQTAAFPELYCVSTKSFETVNQINLFMNNKGTVRMNLQFWTTDGEHEGNFDTDVLQTITQLKFDPSTGTIGNSANKLKLILNTTALSPAQASAAMRESRAAFDFLNPPGNKAEFKKYYLAEMTDYNLPGKRNRWDSRLMAAYKAGVKQYLCGSRTDIIRD